MPLTVTVSVPWLELLPAANVNALLDVARLWLKDAPTRSADRRPRGSLGR